MTDEKIEMPEEPEVEPEYPKNDPVPEGDGEEEDKG